MGVGRLFGGAVSSGGGAAEIPAYSYSGDHLVRFQVYNGVLYAEWELISSGTLSFAEAQTFDAYLIGPGGQAGPGQTGTYPGKPGSDGGGSGYPAELLSATSPAGGSLLVVVGAELGTTSVTGTGVLASASGGGTGVGYIGPYNLYGDPAYPKGVATAPEPAVPRTITTEGAKGGEGCTVNPLVSALPTLWCTFSGSVPVPGFASKCAKGYGAGGTGVPGAAYYLEWSGRDFYADTRQSRGKAAQGVVLIRVALS